MIVFGCTASNGLDIGLARALGCALGKIDTTKFPDGEIKVRVPQTDDKQIVIVQSTYSPQEKNLMELIFTAHALKGRGAEVCAVIPYLAYARQNKSFAAGESISINAVMDMLASAGIGSIITGNPHKSESLDYFKGKTCIADCAQTMAEGMKKQLDKPYVLAPYHSALNVAQPAAKVLGCDCTFIEKERDAYGNVTMKKSHGGDFEGKSVVIIDDMIAAGSTVELAARFAYDNGADSVYAAGIHLVMVGGAYERLKNAGIKRIFGTNTIPCERAETFDVSKDVVKCVKKVFQ